MSEASQENPTAMALERLRLGSPMAGEAVVYVDPQKTGGSLVVVVQTLQPGGHLPAHQCANEDRVVFVHKGQGRMTVNERAMTVVPGATVPIPRTAWFGMRNTGTGMFQVVWSAVPGGWEQFFREWCAQGASPDPSALTAVGQRFGVEFRSEALAAPAQTPAHRGHRGGRRRGRERGGPSRPPAPGPAPAAPETMADSASLAGEPDALSAVEQPLEAGSSQPPAAPAGPPRPAQPSHRRRGRRRQRGNVPGRAPAQGTSAVGPAAPPSSTGHAPAPSSPTPPSTERGRGGGGRGQRSRRRGRVREVYMGGRWIKVTGDGPVIDFGRERPRKGEGDEDGPTGPLSVPL